MIWRLIFRKSDNNTILDEELSVFTNVHPVRNWTKGKHLISTNCSAAKQLPQFSSYLNMRYLSNVSIKQIFVRPICHKFHYCVDFSFNPHYSCNYIIYNHQTLKNVQFLNTLKRAVENLGCFKQTRNIFTPKT